MSMGIVLVGMGRKELVNCRHGASALAGADQMREMAEDSFVSAGRGLCTPSEGANVPWTAFSFTCPLSKGRFELSTL